MTLFTGVLAICTLLLVVVGALQWCTLRSTERFTHETQRAIVYLQGVTTRLSTKVNEPACCVFNLPSVQNREQVIAVAFLVGNSGDSQTQRLKIVTRCVPTGPAKQPDEPFTWFKWDDSKAVQQVIAPKQVIAVEGCFLTQEDLLNFQMGITHEYLLGEVRYGDRPDRGQPFVTQLAQELHVTDGWNDITKFRGFTLGVGQHNCTDDDCQN